MILHLEPFHFATADLAASGWNTVDSGPGQVLVEAASGRRGARNLRVDEGSQAFGNTCYVSRILTPGDNKIVLGLAYEADNMSGTTHSNFSIVHGGTVQLSFRLNVNRTVTLYRGDLSTALGTTSITIPVGTYCYIELVATIHASAGSFSLYINNVLALSGSGVNTSASGSALYTGIRLGYNTGDQGLFITQRYCDLYVLDGIASADAAHPNNVRWGDTRVDARAMTAEGTTNNGTPTSGTDNSAMVDDAQPDGDTTTVTLATVGDIELYVCQDAPVAGGRIMGFQIDIDHKKSDAGVATIAAAVRHSGTNYFSANLSPATSYLYSRVPYDLNPGTTLATTESEFNAFEIGLKKTA